MERNKRTIGKRFTELFKKPQINRSYKDILFRFVLADKKALLKLYNALNETDYNDENDLEINTLENVIYIGYKNDLSFIIGNTINIYEHQSTVNPNMPLRGLRYLTQLYNVYIDMADDNIYGSTLIHIPRPQAIVFYNGDESYEERKTLRLSDAFKTQDSGKYDSNLEFTITVLNINYGNNKDIMAKCCELEQYAQFIHIFRGYIKQGFNKEEALRRAIDKCIEKGILKDILIRNRAEVMEMMLTKYDFEAHMRVIRKEGREEGRLEADAKWGKVVADKDAELADKDTEIADKDAELAKKDAIIADLLAKQESKK